jgi:hypothetical protein
MTFFKLFIAGKSSLINLELIRTINIRDNYIDIVWSVPIVDGNMFWFRTFPNKQRIKFDTANEANAIYSEIVAKLT